MVPEADIPAIDTGRFLTPFDVQVFNVSNPDHFYVHSVHSLQLLNTLMLRLKVPSLSKHNLVKSEISNPFYGF